VLDDFKRKTTAEKAASAFEKFQQTLASRAAAKKPKTLVKAPDDVPIEGVE
jgi:hypothetical protein